MRLRWVEYIRRWTAELLGWSPLSHERRRRGVRGEFLHKNKPRVTEHGDDRQPWPGLIFMVAFIVLKKLWTWIVIRRWLFRDQIDVLGQRSFSPQIGSMSIASLNLLIRGSRGQIFADLDRGIELEFHLSVALWVYIWTTHSQCKSVCYLGRGC